MGYLAPIRVFVKTGVVMVLDGVLCRVRGVGKRLSGKPTFGYLKKATLGGQNWRHVPTC